jgi:hypothetical protein
MASLTPYTTTDAVRGALGVDAVEIPDARMVDRGLDTEMLLWASGKGLDHAAVKTAADAAPTGVVEQADYQRLCLAFMYLGASLVAESPIQFMLSIGDGKNQMKRYDGVDWAELAKSLRGKADSLLAGITTFVPPVAPGFKMMSRATPTTDPVTNT